MVQELLKLSDVQLNLIVDHFLPILLLLVQFAPPSLAPSIVSASRLFGTREIQRRLSRRSTRGRILRS